MARRTPCWRALRAQALALGGTALDLLWPAQCPVCEQWIELGQPGVVCSRGRAPSPLLHRCCLRALPRATFAPGWPRALHAGAPLRWAYADSPALFALLHAAKYGGRSALLTQLAVTLAHAGVRAGWLTAQAVLVPAPDDPLRLRERGFSPARLIASALARRAGCPLRGDLLRRRRAAPPQARLRDPLQRWRNVDGMFSAGNLAEIPRDRPLVLVEDQITTGATAQAALRILGARGNPVAGLALGGASRAPREVGLDTPLRGSLECLRRGWSLTPCDSST
jgi:predicted amidophosphoribosyltransferase